MPFDVQLGGGGQDAAPPQAPAVPMPQLPQQQQDPGGVNDKTKQLLQMIAQASQRKQLANTAMPRPMQEETPMARGGAHPRQETFHNIGAIISNAVAREKNNQLLKAEGDWTYLQSSMNELFQAQQSGDQQAVKTAQAKVDVMMNDPKKLKNMAKALNQDWLNPEKTTVYGEALKNVTAKTEKQDAAKAQAKQGIQGIFQKLIQKRQQPQLTPEQTQAMGKEIQAKAPIQTPGTDSKEAVKILEEQMKEEARTKQEEAKEAARAKELETKAANEKEATEMKQKFTEHRDQMQNTFKDHMESLKETASAERQNKHDMMMMEALGMKLDAQQKKMFATDSNKVNKEITDSVTSLRQQLAQANSALKSIRTSASNHWLMGPGKDEIKDAEGNVTNLQKAIEHIEKNRDAIIKGKAELGDVVGKAYDIMGGGGGATVPGFVPDK